VAPPLRTAENVEKPGGGLPPSAASHMLLSWSCLIAPGFLLPGPALELLLPLAYYCSLSWSILAHAGDFDTFMSPSWMDSYLAISTSLPYYAFLGGL
jgi:hypothetical protein